MIFRGKDDLTNEIDEYYHSHGDYTHDKDITETDGGYEKRHAKHSVAEEVSEGERKKYVDHSKHSFAEEVAEGDKNYRGAYSDETPHSYGNSYGKTGKKSGRRVGCVVALIFLIFFGVGIAEAVADFITNDAKQEYIDYFDDIDNGNTTVAAYAWETFDEDMPYYDEVTAFSQFVMNDCESIDRLVEKNIADKEFITIEVNDYEWNALIFCYPESDDDKTEIAETMYDVETWLDENNISMTVMFDITDENNNGFTVWVGADDGFTAEDYNDIFFDII